MASRPNWKLPLALSAVLFVVGTVVYWNEFTRKPKAEQQEENQKKVFPIQDQMISELKVIDERVPGSPKNFEFRCLDLDKKLCKVGDATRWELVSPLKFKADDASVNGFLSSLNNVQPVETIDLTEDPAEKRPQILQQYKLDEASRKSSRRVEFKIDGKTKVAYFGDTHPIHEGLFVTYSDNPDKVFVVPSYFTMNLEKDLSYWRDKKVLTVNASDVIGFKLSGTKGSSRIARKDGEWQLEGGLAGDIENVDAFVTSLTYLTAKDFADRKALQGAKAGLKVDLELANQQTLTVTFHRKGYKDPTQPGSLYATASNLDLVYEIDPSTFDRLDKSAGDFRLSKLITSLDRYGAKRIEVAGPTVGPSPVVMEQKDGKWLDSKGQDANNERVQAFFDKISGNRIQQFVSGREIPPGEKEGLTIKIATEGGAHKRELVFWRAGTLLFARDRLSKRTDEAFRVDSAITDNLPWEKDWFFVKPSPSASPNVSAPPSPGHGHQH